MTSPDTLTTVADRLLTRVGHWESARWSQSGRPPATRADLFFGLVQGLADLGAHAEARDPRPVPRLDDHALPDQFAVMVGDLVEFADSATRRAAAELIESTAREISPET